MYDAPHGTVRQYRSEIALKNVFPTCCNWTPTSPVKRTPLLNAVIVCEVGCKPACKHAVVPHIEVRRTQIAHVRLLMQRFRQKRSHQPPGRLVACHNAHVRVLKMVPSSLHIELNPPQYFYPNSHAFVLPWVSQLSIHFWQFSKTSSSCIMQCREYHESCENVDTLECTSWIVNYTLVFLGSDPPPTAENLLRHLQHEVPS